jgi:hypothetical protein
MTMTHALWHGPRRWLRYRPSVILHWFDEGEPVSRCGFVRREFCDEVDQRIWVEDQRDSMCAVCINHLPKDE